MFVLNLPSYTSAPLLIKVIIWSGFGEVRNIPSALFSHRALCLFPSFRSAYFLSLARSPLWIQSRRRRSVPATTSRGRAAPATRRRTRDCGRPARGASSSGRTTASRRLKSGDRMRIVLIVRGYRFFTEVGSRSLRRLPDDDILRLGRELVPPICALVLRVKLKHAYEDTH